MADGEAVGDGLAGAGLGGDEEVAAVGGAVDDGGLDGRRLLVIMFSQRACQRRAGFECGQVCSLVSGREAAG